MNYDNNTYILRYFRKITYKERTKGRGPEGLTELPRSAKEEPDSRFPLGVHRGFWKATVGF